MTMTIEQPATPPMSQEIPTPSETTTSGDGEQKNPAPQPKPSERIKYRVRYVGLDRIVLHEQETAGLDPEEHVPEPTQKHAFEIITTYQTGKKAFEKGQTILSGTAPSRHMVIHSVAIMHALRSVVEYYPIQDLTSDVIEIKAPYPVLVHHYDELMEYREKFKPGNGVETCFREKDAYEDLGILKEFMDENIMPAVREERARNRRGYRTFEMDWLAVKPGQAFISHFRDEGRYKAGILHAYKQGAFLNPSVEGKIEYWTLEYNGNCVSRKMNYADVTRYDGELSMSRRPVDLNEYPREEAVQKLIDDGRLYWDLIQKQCKYYKGKTVTFPHNDVEGLVMVDLDAYYGEKPTEIPSIKVSPVDSRSWVSDCECSVCGRRRANKTKKHQGPLASIERIYPKGTDTVTDAHWFLLPNKITAFVFRTRTWEKLSVNGFSNPEFDENMIENLVMDKKRVQTLKALAKSYVRLNQFGMISEREPWSADFVKGKGNGLIFLLHGRPGVGKTCTAECIAAFTSRPLMVLTSSDIGTQPHEVEANLTRHFKTAKSWGAVLLIDEADVFMERRSTADLNRNTLVAGFLRALEFYDGILFLTTNRIGSFDDAFISRIHVQLYYPDFDEEDRRKIWQTFVDKLHLERKDYIRLNIDGREYLNGNELKAVKWNGREIRNAFQTAVALAEYEATKDEEGKIVLTDKHLKAVVEMSRDFKDYLSELHAGDEGKRAQRRRERLDN